MQMQMTTDKALCLISSASDFLQPRRADDCSCGNCLLCAVNHLVTLAAREDRREKVEACMFCGNDECPFRDTGEAPDPCPRYQRSMSGEIGSTTLAVCATQYLADMEVRGFNPELVAEVLNAAINSLRMKHPGLSWQNSASDDDIETARKS